MLDNTKSKLAAKKLPIVECFLMLLFAIRNFMHNASVNFYTLSVVNIYLNLFLSILESKFLIQNLTIYVIFFPQILGL